MDVAVPSVSKCNSRKFARLRRTLDRVQDAGEVARDDAFIGDRVRTPGPTRHHERANAAATPNGSEEIVVSLEGEARLVLRMGSRPARSPSAAAST